MTELAADRYLLLADISGYTGFLGAVEEKHGQDFSTGLPAGYQALGVLIDLLIEGLPPGFELVKVEGDAVFASAPAAGVDGQGPMVLADLGRTYRAFLAQREAISRTATDDMCDACLVVNTLDLKAVLHRGFAVQRSVGRQADVIGPAVNVAHRLLKNTVREVIGYRPYVLVSAPAAENLGIADLGIEHHESYPDVGVIDTRIIDLAPLAEAAQI